MKNKETEKKHKTERKREIKRAARKLREKPEERRISRKWREPPVERARSNGPEVVYGWKRRGSTE